MEWNRMIYLCIYLFISLFLYFSPLHSLHLPTTTPFFLHLLHSLPQHFPSSSLPLHSIPLPSTPISSIHSFHFTYSHIHTFTHTFSPPLSLISHLSNPHHSIHTQYYQYYIHPWKRINHSTISYA